MARVPKKTIKKNAKNKVSSKVRDYSNEPFFVKKAEEAKKFLEKHPIPEELLPKK